MAVLCVNSAARHELCDLLLQHGADPNAPTKEERKTPLHIACMNSMVDVGKLLVGKKFWLLGHEVPLPGMLLQEVNYFKYGYFIFVVIQDTFGDWIKNEFKTLQVLQRALDFFEHWVAPFPCSD